MDTKLKGWTARPAVKIVCFILILVLCFTVINRAFAIVLTADETNISPDVVLVDLSTNQYFYDQHMRQAQDHASVLSYFGSEEAITAGRHLMWFESNDAVNHYDFYDYYDDNYIFETDSWSELRTPDGSRVYLHITGSNRDNPGYRSRYEAIAIRRQLREFRAAQEYLNNIEGLMYYIGVDMSSLASEGIADARSTLTFHEDGEGVSVEFEWFDEDNIINNIQHDFMFYSNVSEGAQTAGFFRSQPVYFIATGDGQTEHSNRTDSSVFRHYESGINPVRGEIFIAFSSQMVNFQYSVYSTVRNTYIRDLSIVAASVLLMLGLTVILLAGAGRKRVPTTGDPDRATEVHFTLFDKPYLDIGLTAMILWTAFIAFIGVQTINTAWHHRNVIVINVIFAAVVLLVAPLALLWVISFVKRLKAGQFWKHTLIYAILYSCLYGALRFCVKKVKSLWAGTRLTYRVALISVISFFMMLFVGIAGIASQYSPIAVLLLSLLLAAVVAYFLLRYANRIHKLELGAREACNGKYDAPIDAGGGELGSIADSIMNISAGINTAVEQRLKSERLKTELITNVSHDIRTPLTSIITYTDLLKSEGLDCEKAPEYLDILIQKSQRLKTLTDELFEAAKAATGNIDISLTELDIVSLINQVLGELDGALKTSGLNLKVNLPEKLLAIADGRLMQRVMENLMSNVFKYSLPGSRVYIDALPVDDSGIQIDIKNISAAELNFDP